MEKEKNTNNDKYVNKIYNKDCKLLIKEMIDNNVVVDAIITDPPYNISRDNNFDTMGRSGIDFGKWDKEFDLVGWIEGISKIIKKGGNIIIFNDWRNMGLIADALEADGFIIKDLIRWIKPNPMPRNVNRRYVTDYEVAIWAVKPKGKWTFNKPDDVPYIRPEINGPTASGTKRIHPTQKGRKIIGQLIEVHTNDGDIVFDPFSGSGEISFVANSLGRNYIASELDEGYFNKSLKRFK